MVHNSSFETVSQLNRHAKKLGCFTSYCASSEGCVADAEFTLDDVYAEKLEQWMLVMIENTARKIESQGLSIEEVSSAIPENEDAWFSRGKHLLAHWLLDRPMGEAARFL